MIERVLSKMEATVWYRWMIYKAVAQSVLSYGSDRWVVTGDILKVFEGLYHHVASQIIGLTPTRRAGVEWEYPPVMREMEAVVIHPLRENMRIRQATISENVA